MDWQFQKAAAERAVRELIGVKGVSNLVEVRPKVSATEINSQIEAALKRSAVFDANRITMEVDGDKVILRGTVRSAFEREAAERGAWRAPGVREVDNRILIGTAAAAWA